MKTEKYQVLSAKNRKTMRVNLTMNEAAELQSKLSKQGYPTVVRSWFSTN